MENEDQAQVKKQAIKKRQSMFQFLKKDDTDDTKNSDPAKTGEKKSFFKKLFGKK
jgi:uncharacterized protein involved in tellurium resistance